VPQWPLSDAGRSETGGVVAASSVPETLTASGTAHIKGAWTQLIAATDFDVSGIWMMHRDGISVSAVDTSMLIDIGLGAAASERVLVENIAVGFSGSTRSIFLPVYIPSGERIAARCQSAVVSETVDAQCLIIGGGWMPGEHGGRATTYGASTAVSSGTLMATPGAVNTKGAWTELSASTANPIRWLIPCIAPTNNAVLTATGVLVDIGYGSAGNEQVLIADLGARISTSEVCHTPHVTVPTNLPAGIRLVARHAGSSVAATAIPRVLAVGVD
jgi:hypothetical protein